MSPRDEAVSGPCVAKESRHSANPSRTALAKTESTVPELRGSAVSTQLQRRRAYRIVFVVSGISNLNLQSDKDSNGALPVVSDPRSRRVVHVLDV